ncbi:hypothetical protein FRC04_011412 [Tulasnella sp. 424]|nr:hypothetical protein FRC04_011412 [Tulasnella sp. 424]KAG8971934.1 hypothetical protein FRC05_010469 [Tulasnella sp. 425]
MDTIVLPTPSAPSFNLPSCSSASPTAIRAKDWQRLSQVLMYKPDRVDAGPSRMQPRSLLQTIDFPLPRALMRPDNLGLVAFAPESRTGKAREIVRRDSSLRRRMQAGAAATKLHPQSTPGSLSTGKQREAAVTSHCSPSPTADGMILPTHILALRIGPQDPRWAYIPVHWQTLAAFCNRPPPSLFTPNTNNNVPPNTVPLVEGTMPFPQGFQVLRDYFYSRSLASLLGALLPADLENLQEPSTLRNFNASPAYIKQRRRSAPEALESLARAIAATYTAHDIVARTKWIYGVYLNAWCLLVNDTDVWTAIAMTWSVITRRTWSSPPYLPSLPSATTTHFTHQVKRTSQAMKSRLALLLAASYASRSYAADRAIFITPSSQLQSEPSSTAQSQYECLNGAFYGRYGRPLRDVYIVSPECAIQAAGVKASGSMAYLEDDEDAGEDRLLVWLQDAGVDESLRKDEDPVLSDMSIVPKLLDIAERKSRSAGVGKGEEGLVVQEGAQFAIPKESESRLHYLDKNSALISIPPSRLGTLDTFLPRFIVPILLPTTPLLPKPIDPHAVARIQAIISALKFNPSIAAVLSSLSTERMAKDARWLTAENADSEILSRHSFTEGAKVAAEWIQGEVEKSGAVCELRSFREGFAPNVICRYPSTVNTTATTILSAHYDSRGSFGSLRAPGGDDDGSGTTHVLAIARLIKEKKITFKNRVELVLFAGEEQGLVGSRAYAAQLREANANVTLHIQADMLAFRSSKEPPQLGLPDLIGLPEAAYLVANISKLYAPELTVGYTSACCSDHQSFWEQGFPATQVFERAGPIIDPMYHNSGDLTNRTGYDFDQLLSITKVTFATVLETAGFDIVPVEDE